MDTDTPKQRGAHFSVPDPENTGLASMGKDTGAAKVSNAAAVQGIAEASGTATVPRAPEAPDAVPEAPDAVPEAPDAVPEAPDAVPEAPDADATVMSELVPRTPKGESAAAAAPVATAAAARATVAAAATGSAAAAAAPSAESAKSPSHLGTISAGVSTYRPSRRTAKTTERVSARYHTKERRRSRSLVTNLVAGVLIVAFVAVLVVFVMPRVFPGDTTDAEENANLAEAGTEVQVTIPSGAYATDIATILYDAGLISSTSDFLSAVTRQDAASTLKSGTYTIIAGSDVTEIIAALQVGGISGVIVTIPEGYTLISIAERCAEVYSVLSEDFVSQAKASYYVADYPFLATANNDSLEGYLFPKTYGFESVEVSCDELIRAMLDQFASETESLDLSGSAERLSSEYGISITVNDIVIMASIIEREALSDEQRPLVASVFYNRLAIGMALQSDATLWYSLGTAPTGDQLQSLNDPYNTYLNTGLTPTPICSASLASLEAACNPSSTDYLYFAIYSTEDYQFAADYNEHANYVNAHN